MKLFGLLFFGFGFAFACSEEPRDDDDPGGGDGDADGDGDGDADPTQQLGSDDCASLLTAVIRDFPNDKSVAPDFYISGYDYATLGMVKDTLDKDHKPQVGSVDMSSSHLSDWYRTKSGVNMEYTYEIALTKQSSGHFVYDNSDYFPMDTLGGYGKDIPEYADHNWLFTSELKLSFIYEAGQTFTFRGDDDLWVFIEGKLALDVGGIHSPVESSFNMDTFNADNNMGMVQGRTYEMRIFHAERNPTMSNFRIDTTIGCFADAPIV